MDKERQIRYNYLPSSESPGATDWFFLIINQNREIREHEQKIYDLLCPIFNSTKGTQGIVRGNDLRYKLLCFSSYKSTELKELRRLYKRVVKDNHLYNRQTINGLENYLADHLEK